MIKYFLIALPVLCLSGCSFDQTPFANEKAVTIEVTKLGEYKDAAIVLEATLKAPEGTKISDGSVNEHSLENKKIEYLLISEMYWLPTSYQGSDVHPIIDTSFYAPFHSSANDIQVIPEAVMPYDSIESYADYASPGVYTLKKGESFCLGKIKQSNYCVNIIDVP